MSFFPKYGDVQAKPLLKYTAWYIYEPGHILQFCVEEFSWRWILELLESRQTKELTKQKILFGILSTVCEIHGVYLAHSGLTLDESPSGQGHCTFSLA